MLWIMLITECMKTKGLLDSPWQTAQVNYSALHVQVVMVLSQGLILIFIFMCSSKAKHLNRLAFDLEEEERKCV